MQSIRHSLKFIQSDSPDMRQLFLLLLFLAGIISPRAINAQTTFSKYLSNTPPNTSFSVARGLSNQDGYLLLADRYTTERLTFVIRTDSALVPIWTRKLDFSQAPFDNTKFYDIGELPGGNYYLFGETGDAVQGIVWYVVLVLDTNGVVIHHTAIRDTTHAVNASNIPRIHVGLDGKLLIATTEYEWIGFYRLDTNLALLSSGFYQLSSNAVSRGNDCIMLADSNLLLTGDGFGAAFTLTKTTTQGTILWSKGYSGAGRIFSLYEAPDRTVYAGGSNGLPFLARLDSAGNLLWLHEYNTTTSNIASSAVYGIYPMSNGHLMIYCDSVTFEIDTLGVPLNPGYAQPKDNYGELRPVGTDFTYCALIYQGVVSSYMHTIMRFPTPAGSSCMSPRTLVSSNPTWSPVVLLTTGMNSGSFQQSLLFSDSLVPFFYDAMPACPPGPNGIEDDVALISLSVFPNPATDAILFNGKSEWKMAVAEVIDMNGRVVLTGTPEPLENGMFRIPIGELTDGMYALRIYENGIAVGYSAFCVQRGN
jgi:hypothetical protein